MRIKLSSLFAVLALCFLFPLSTVFAMDEVAIASDSTTFSLSQNHPVSEVRNAISSVRNGDYQNAIAVLQDYSGKGDVGASYVLGKLFTIGAGVEKSTVEAEKLFLANVDEGHTPSMLALAQVKMTASPGQALFLIKHAASIGDAIAMTELGSIFETGKLGVEKNLGRAIDYYRKAAEAGSAYGNFQLAKFYDDGIGVSANEVLATRLYRKAAMQGVIAANAVMARRYFDGKGLEADPIAAMGWLTRGAQNGSSEAMVVLGEQFESGETVPKDLNRAGQLYSQAAKLGDSVGTYRLALMYLNGSGIKADPIRAYVLLSGAQSLPKAKKELERLNSTLPADQLKLAKQQVEKIIESRTSANR